MLQGSFRKSGWRDSGKPRIRSRRSGFGAFSYSRSDVPNAIAYIRDQEKHHRVRTFQEEYLEMLKAFEIEHDEGYIFKPVE